MPLPKDISHWFVYEAQLPHPKWQEVKAWIDQQLPPEEHDEAWHELITVWLDALAPRLKGQYRRRESRHFILFSAQGEQSANRTMAHAEDSLQSIYALLGEVARDEFLGKIVLLVLDKLNDFYGYIGHYYPEQGEFIGPVGVTLNTVYDHIALPRDGLLGGTLVHELVYVCLSHLDMPLWLNEGLASTLGHHSAGYPHRVDPARREKLERHAAFWNAQTVQAFWSGLAFGGTGDSAELSYDLTEMLVRELIRGGKDFRQFVMQASWRDAGQDAAIRHLGVNLGDVLAGLLGPGPWAPAPDQWNMEELERIRA
jgi:hypothetical protein